MVPSTSAGSRRRSSCAHCAAVRTRQWIRNGAPERDRRTRGGAREMPHHAVGRSTPTRRARLGSLFSGTTWSRERASSRGTASSRELRAHGKLRVHGELRVHAEARRDGERAEHSHSRVGVVRRSGASTASHAEPRSRGAAGRTLRARRARHHLHLGPRRDVRVDADPKALALGVVDGEAPCAGSKSRPRSCPPRPPRLRVGQQFTTPRCETNLNEPRVASPAPSQPPAPPREPRQGA